MKRRAFLRAAGLACAGVALSNTGRLLAETVSWEGWRTFEVTTHIEVLRPRGTTRIWTPAALIGDTPFQRTLSNRFKAAGGRAKLIESKLDGLGMVVATFPDGVRPVLTLSSRIMTKDYVVDLSKPNHAHKTSRAELEPFLRPTEFLPTDGL